MDSVNLIKYKIEYTLSSYILNNIIILKDDNINSVTHKTQFSVGNLRFLR